ncbi:MAG: TerB family tellurite resistance protein [Alcanivoracaceae bacterium]|nr:TerB family tellurite resistance protein [Alcanivoracaceae bacterium]
MSPHQKLDNYLEKVVKQLSTSALHTVNSGELAKQFDFTGNDHFSREDIQVLRDCMQARNLQSERDFSRVFRKISLDENLIFFLSIPEPDYSTGVLSREKVFFSILSLLARADGELSATEIDYIESCCKIRSMQQLIPEIRVRAIAHHALSRPKSDLGSSLKAIKKLFSLREDAIDFFANIIVSDGHIDKREVYMFRDLIALLDFGDLKISDAKQILEAQAKKMHITIFSKKPKNMDDDPENLPAEDEDEGDWVLNDILADFL